MNNELEMINNRKIDEIVTALTDLADSVENGDCGEPSTNLFDADSFWVMFDEEVRPLITSVIDTARMD